MPDFTQPSEIAREVLRRLAQRRIPPTPDNYLALYHEISGTPPTEVFPERRLKSIAAAMPREVPEQLRLGRLLDQSIAEKNWVSLKQALSEAFTKLGASPPNWSALLRELMGQLDARSTGVTTAQKREAMDRVLAASATPDLLFQRLQGLLRNWARAPEDSAQPLAEMPGDIVLPAATTSAPPRAVAPSAERGGAEWRELIALILDNALPPLLADAPDLAEEAAQLSTEIRSPEITAQVHSFSVRLKKFIYRLHFIAEDQAELKAALLSLLRLLVENIDELVIDDEWLQGQVAVVSDLVNQPLNLRRLDDVERRLRDLIYKQSTLKKSLNDARDRLRSMLATFVDRLADMSATTGDYHQKMERCASRVGAAQDIAELTDVLDEVMRETRTIQFSALKSRDDLSEMRLRVDEAEKEVARLQEELAQTSDMVRIDALTGTLNRKGMDEALEREVARTRRQSVSLCVALLDIDNFKHLNDNLGHEAGDEALKHLAQVVREAIRPQDTLARYGGEEFVILLPDTPLDAGVSAMARVQRELTRKFFLHKNEKLLITFSCGVAELGNDEASAAVLNRADQAMYLAKRAGKNRVVAA
ncbi:MAG: diguanylate cyclase [Rhodocyclaceae bacterium]|nr:diguanylate cyclase [Rhodocyclaceae bacterium]